MPILDPVKKTIAQKHMMKVPLMVRKKQNHAVLSLISVKELRKRIA